MQQVGSICLAANLDIRARWCPSESNPADGPSRGQVNPGPFQKPPRREEELISQEAGDKASNQHPRSQIVELSSRESCGRPLKEARVLPKSQSGRRAVTRAKRTIQARTLPDCFAGDKPAGSRARGGQMTVLETKSISSECLTQYGQYLGKFKAFCKVNGARKALGKEETDAWLSDYMDVMFAEGRAAHEGEKHWRPWSSRTSSSEVCL